MNIIFFTRRFYPQIGGVETHVLELSKELIKRGHNITVISEQIDNFWEKEKKQSSSTTKGIRVLKIQTGKSEKLKKFRIWFYLLKKREIIKKADIIHCHDVFFWYLPFLFLYPKKKVFTTFHGHETKFPPSKKAVVIRKISEKFSYGNICVGDYIKKWYKTNPNDVVYGGVRHTNPDKNVLLENKKHLEIVYIGRLQKDMGIDTYSEGLRLLKDKNINFSFNAYGEGDMRTEVEKYGTINSFKENINDVIKKSDIILCSSYLTMLQALEAGKIVIAVYENELKEAYLKDSPFSKFIYICKNAKEVANVISSIAVEPWKSKSMLNNGHKWAKEQTWEKIASTYIKLWKI